MIAAAIACAAGVALTLVGERLHASALRWAGKPLASAAFLAVAWCARPSGAFAAWVVAGLALGAIGDVALLARRGFLVGLGAFLLGHVAYAAAVQQLVPARAWLGLAGALAPAPIIAAAGALAWLWPHLGRLRTAVIAYAVAITAMAIAAIALWRAGASPHPGRFALGALLFFASDLAVARDAFVARAFANKAWGLPAYYAGQLLIALSIYP